MTGERLARILIPLDGSSAAEEILPQIRRLLPPEHSELVPFHAMPLGPLADGRDSLDYLRHIAAPLTRLGYRSTPLIRQGSPADSILDAASEVGASLIAMTTHGRSGPGRWLLGSVADRVLQASVLPVLAVRVGVAGGPPPEREASPVLNILVPLDGSRLSLGVLGSVLPLARPLNAQVTLLHVSEPPPCGCRWDPPDETLEEADQLLRAECIPVKIEHRTGDPWEEIVKASQGGRADLVAMTTHGRSGPSRWVFGSVTSKVLRSSSAPLLVVRGSLTPSGENRPSRGESLRETPFQH